MFCLQNLLFTSLEIPAVCTALFLFLCALDPSPLRCGRVETVGATHFCLRSGRMETMRADDAVSRAEGVLLGGGRVGELVGGRDSKRVSRRVGGRVNGRVGGGVGRVGGCIGSHVDLAALLDLAFDLVFDFALFVLALPGR